MGDTFAPRVKRVHIERLIKDLKEGDTYKREKAVEILSGLSDGKVITATIPLIYEKDTSVRMAAVEVLKKVGGTKLEAILSLFSDESEDVRIYACDVVGYIKDERAIPYLLKALKSDTENVRVAACSALGEFKREDVVDALTDVLEDSEWIAFSAISSLGKIKDPKSIPHLTQRLKTGSDLIAMAACEALLKYKDPRAITEVALTIKGFKEEKKSAFLKVIVDRVEDGFIDVLYENFGEDIFPYLKDAILLERRRSKDLLGLLKYFKTHETVELLINLLNDMGEDHEDYEFVLDILSELKEVWIHSLDDYLKRGESYAAHIINCAVNEEVKIEEKPLLEIFTTSSLEVKRIIVKHLDKLCTDGKKILILALKDKDGHIRGDAAEVVGKKKWNDMEMEILRLVRNDYADVRIKALKSLIAINREKAKSEIEKFVSEGTKEDKKVYVSCSSMLSADENYKFVMELLKSHDLEEKRLAVHIIEGFIEDERYHKLVKDLLEGDLIPYEVLKIVKDKRLIQFKDRVVEIFGDKTRDTWTRYFAISALSSFDDKGLFPVFVEAVKDENPLIRIAGIKGFLSIKEKKALDYILPLKEDKDQDVRLEAQYVGERLMEL
ncbi:MAG: HEAT repeat domain-containing protein [Deltaproteobacteria bacterium]|nr:HEAT repeat domain-containing protein [Deltaproteobacteria bacterium]